MFTFNKNIPSSYQFDNKGVHPKASSMQLVKWSYICNGDFRCSLWESFEQFSQWLSASRSNAISEGLLIIRKELVQIVL